MPKITSLPKICTSGNAENYVPPIKIRTSGNAENYVPPIKIRTAGNAEKYVPPIKYAPLATSRGAQRGVFTHGDGEGPQSRHDGATGGKKQCAQVQVSDVSRGPGYTETSLKKNKIFVKELFPLQEKASMPTQFQEEFATDTPHIA